MALTYNEISSITQKLFIPKLVDNIFASNALLNRMKKKSYRLESGGTSIMVPLMYAQTTAAGWYVGDEALNTTANDQITAAEYDWKQAYASITITRADELKNSGKEQIINFVKSKVQVAEKSLADKLGTALFSAAAASGSFAGLRLACSASGTYGGIDRASNSWWNGQEVNTATVASVSGFQSLFGDCSIDADRPTVAVCTQAIYDSIYDTITPNQRFTSADVAEAGFTNIMVNGIPLIVDSHCPASHLFMLNEKYLEIVAHRDENFRFEPFIKPVNQNVSTAKVYWMGSLTSSNSRMHGMATAMA